MILPDEWRLDIRAAAAAIAALDPDTPVALTIAQLGDGGLEAEGDTYLRAEEAAALLETVGDDQRLRVGQRDLFVVRVARTDR